MHEFTPPFLFAYTCPWCRQSTLLGSDAPATRIKRFVISCPLVQPTSNVVKHTFSGIKCSERLGRSKDYILASVLLSSSSFENFGESTPRKVMFPNHAMYKSRANAPTSYYSHHADLEISLLWSMALCTERLPLSR